MEDEKTEETLRQDAEIVHKETGSPNHLEEGTNGDLDSTEDRHVESENTDITDNCEERHEVNEDVTHLERQEAAESRVCGLCEEGNPAEGRCLECNDDLCSNCLKYHEKLRVTSSHNVILFEAGSTHDVIIPSRSSTECQKHGERLKFYCKMCNVSVCRDCILTLHKDHQAVDLADEMSSAKKETERLLSKVQGKAKVTETELTELRTYHTEFLGKTKKVSDVIEKLHTAVLNRVEQSFKELTEKILTTKNSETARVQQLEEFLEQRLRSASDFRAIADHVLVSQDGTEVMVKLEMLRRSIGAVCNQVDIAKGHGEFLVAKNPRFTSNTAENILGRVAFSLKCPTKQVGIERHAFVKEIRLAREVAFHIWEMHCTKPSVRGIVESTEGVIWIATPRSLLKVGQDGSRRNTAHLTSDIVSIARGPAGSILASFNERNVIKMYNQDNWSNFAIVPEPISCMVATGDGQRVLVPQKLETAAKLLFLCNMGRDMVNIELPDQLSKNGQVPGIAVGLDGQIAICAGQIGMVMLLSPTFDYRAEYFGPDGVLYPRCVCYDRHGHIIVADSKRCNVQLISSDGQFLSYLLGKENFQDIGYPTAVTVDKRGRLWLGTANGNVCAYTYLHDVM